MQWFRQLFARLFKRKPSEWDTADYGKPSNAGDDFRRKNEV